jgi:hypothetical protein
LTGRADEDSNNHSIVRSIIVEGDQTETLRFELLWAVIRAMHFDTPEGESSPGEYMALLNEIDEAKDPMRKAGEEAVEEILAVLKSHGVALPEIVFQKKYVDPWKLEDDLE